MPSPTAAPAPPQDSTTRPDQPPALGAAETLAEVPDAAPERPGGERAARIQRMFADISHAYDLNNHLLSLNIDRAWRKSAVRMALHLPTRPIVDVLDCCTGTGDLALELAARLPAHAQVIASDFVLPMLERAEQKRQRAKGAPVSFLAGDTMNLPFADESFDLATVAFGIRNVAVPVDGLREMARVLRPGGRLMVLEFTPLRNPVLRWSYHYYFTRVLPVVGGVIARRLDAYRYLARSVEVFPDCEEFKALMEDAGLTGITYRRLSMGIAAVHIGKRP